MKEQIERAKSLGWKHPEEVNLLGDLTFDYWNHPNHPDCQDGRTITLEEMLEIINKK